MASLHTVKQGEHLARIARKYGFGDWRTVWDHPRNAELKQARQNPHVLYPGDQVYIPDRTERTEPAPTGQLSRFRITAPPLLLRLRIEDLDGEPLPKETPCTLAIEGPPFPKKADAKGMIDETITNPELEDGELRVPSREMKLDLKVGDLDPPETRSGQRARLNNLGYFAGYDDNDQENFSWAVEEFKCEHMSKPVKDPEMNEKTWQALVKAHGC